jgi:transcriptional regulator GlxA family with amidase domain
MKRRRVGILVFDEVEVLDFCGPFEVFSTTRLDESRRREGPSPYDVLLVAEKRDVVVASGGLKVVPDHTIEDCPALEVLVVPGGWGTRREVGNARLLAWLGDMAGGAETVASVCTGALLLGTAALLDGRRATTHWKALDWMRQALPAVTVVEDQHVVEDGHVLTSAGISAGIDLALRIVARHHGEEIARATARHMEYPYPVANTRRI